MMDYGKDTNKELLDEIKKLNKYIGKGDSMYQGWTGEANLTNAIYELAVKVKRSTAHQEQLDALQSRIKDLEATIKALTKKDRSNKPNKNY